MPDTPNATAVGSSCSTAQTSPFRRAKYEEIIEKAIEEFGEDSPQAKILKSFLEWVDSDGTPAVRNMMRELGESVPRYVEVFNRVVEEKCREKKHTSYNEIIAAAIEEFGANSKEGKILARFQKWLNKTANPRVRKMIGDLGEGEEVQTYVGSLESVVFNVCGWAEVCSDKADKASKASTIDPNAGVSGVKISKIKPAELKPNETYSIVVEGVNLNKVESVMIQKIRVKDGQEELDAGPFSTLAGKHFHTENGGKKLVFAPITIPGDATAAYYRFHFIGKKGSRDVELGLATVAVLGFGKTKTMREGFRKANIRAFAEIGYYGRVGGRPFSRRATGEIEDKTPVFRTGVAAEPMILGPKDKAYVASPLELSTPVALEYGRGSRNGRTNLLGMSAGLRLAIFPYTSGSGAQWMGPELYGRYDYTNNDYVHPNRMYYSGTSSMITSGLALNIVRSEIEALRLFGQTSWESVAYDRETMGFGFDSGFNPMGTPTIKAGVEGEYNFHKKNPNGNTPNLGFKLELMPQGVYHTFSRASVNFNGEEFVLYSEDIMQRVTGWGFNLEANWDTLKADGFGLAFGYWAETNHMLAENNPARQEYYAEARWNAGGDWRARVNHSDLNWFYPLETTVGAELQWTEPWLRVFYLKPRLDYYTDNRLDDNNTMWGGGIWGGIDLAQLFGVHLFGTREYVRPQSPKPAPAQPAVRPKADYNLNADADNASKL